jgi:hypothetical protein
MSPFSCMTKSVFALIVVALLVTGTCIAGCTSTAPAAAPAPAAPVAPTAATISTAIPDLTGIWTGTTVGHIKMDGFVEENTTRYNITTQKGRAFTGQKEYTRKDGKTYNEGFSGIVTSNNEIFMGDHGTGYIEGRLNGSDSMELYYIDEGSDAKALIIQLNRQKS